MSKPEVKSQSKSCPEPLYALMRQCWEEDPDERPTPNEIKEYLMKSFSIFGDSDNDFTWNENNIKLNNLIKNGKYYQLWSGQLTQRIDVVVKQFKSGKTTNNEIEDEAKLIKELRHKNVPLYLGKFLSSSLYHIVIEGKYCHVLSDYLSTERPSRDFHFNAAKQIASAMAYIENCGLVLRAIRAEGVWLTSSRVCKVSEFTWARKLINGVYQPEATRELIPARWIAPEALKQRSFTPMSDAWSFGILLMELFTQGERPYAELSTSQVIANVKSGYRMPFPMTDPPFPRSVYQLMLKCWNEDELKRPNFQFIENFIEWNLEESLLVNLN